MMNKQDYEHVTRCVEEFIQEQAFEAAHSEGVARQAAYQMSAITAFTLWSRLTVGAQHRDDERRLRELALPTVDSDQWH